MSFANLAVQGQQKRPKVQVLGPALDPDSHPDYDEQEPEEAQQV